MMMTRTKSVVGVVVAVGVLAACVPPAEERAKRSSGDRGGESGALDPKVGEALDAFPDAEVLASRRGVPTFVRGSLGAVAETLAEGNDGPVQAALDRVAPVFKLRREDLTLRTVRTDLLGTTHARYAQTKGGLPVVGGELVLHLDARGVLYAANGGARDGGDAETQASLSAEDAVRIALADLGGNAIAQPAHLVYLQPADEPLVLTWEVDVARVDDATSHALVYVDANDERIVERHPLVHAALARSIHTLDNAVLRNNKVQLPGKLLRAEGAAAHADSIVNSNYDMLGNVHACYSKLFGRDSYDGKGGKLISSVHGRFASGTGSTPNNASWATDVNQMVYGDGDGTTFSNLALSFDITAHEIGHGITNTEAKLVYSKESGAINEAMSDIFAAACDYDRTKSLKSAFVLGEEVYTPKTAGDGLRYLDDPTRDKSSYDYYPDRYTGTNDNGGVHSNSGIANLAFALLVTGGSHPQKKTTVEVTALGMDKSVAVFYRALTEYMTSDTDFAAARAATAQAAKELYGASAETSVNAAWDAVGVPRKNGTPTPAPTPTSPTPSPTPTTAPTPAPTPTTPPPAPAPGPRYGCCLGARCYDCPDKAAADRCVGFDVNACIAACAGNYACMSSCASKASTAPRDPSACKAR